MTVESKDGTEIDGNVKTLFTIGDVAVCISPQFHRMIATRQRRSVVVEAGSERDRDSWKLRNINHGTNRGGSRRSSLK